MSLSKLPMKSLDLIQEEYEHLCLKTRKKVLDKCLKIFENAEKEMSRIIGKSRSSLKPKTDEDEDSSGYSEQSSRGQNKSQPESTQSRKKLLQGYLDTQPESTDSKSLNQSPYSKDVSQMGFLEVVEEIRSEFSKMTTENRRKVVMEFLQSKGDTVDSEFAQLLLKGLHCCLPENSPQTAESGFEESEEPEVDSRLNNGQQISSPTSSSFELEDSVFRDYAGPVDEYEMKILVQRPSWSEESRTESSGVCSQSSSGDRGRDNSSSGESSVNVSTKVSNVATKYSYQIGCERDDFASPQKGPGSPKFIATGGISFFQVIQQQENGIYGLQREDDRARLLHLENKMYSFYMTVPHRKCPSLHPTQLENNGFYALYHSQMRRFVRIRVLGPPQEEESSACVPAVCLIDYGKYETLGCNQLINIRPLQNRFLRLPLQGCTATLATSNEVIPLLMTSGIAGKAKDLIPRSNPQNGFRSLEDKTVRAHVFSCSKDREATFPHLKLVFIERV